MRLERSYIEYLPRLLTPQDFARLQQKVVLVEVKGSMFDPLIMAEDDSGNTYEYAKESDGKHRDDIDPEAWLGVGSYNF